LPPSDSSQLRFAEGPRGFATTQWSVVCAAGEGAGAAADEALARLCAAYWYPLYAYVRRRVADPHEAQDLTQSFFRHLLENQAIRQVDRSRGRFRAFLLAALQNFLTNEWEKARALKRGGAISLLPLDFSLGESRYLLEPADNLTPERLFERRWIMTLLDQVLAQLRAELVAEGKEAQFEQLKGTLAGDGPNASYDAIAGQLGVSPAAAKQAAYRLRKRYREIFRSLVAATLADEADVDDEIRRLMQVLSES